MKKNHFKRNKLNIIVSLLYFIICYCLIKHGILSGEKKDDSFHQSLLTINTIFLGFLFTALGMMVGFSDKSIIKSLDSAGYMDNYYNSIYFGMFFLGSSTVISTIAVVLGSDLIHGWILILEQIGILGGVIFFIKSIIGILRIIRRIRKNN